MAEAPKPSARADGALEEELPAHPRGTLAILLIYALCWVLGWGLLFGLLFLARGAPTTG